MKSNRRIYCEVSLLDGEGELIKGASQRTEIVSGTNSPVFDQVFTLCVWLGALLTLPVISQQQLVVQPSDFMRFVDFGLDNTSGTQILD